jgi:hypothetical protein
MSTIVNPVTGVEYYEISGDSTKRYVAVEADGTIRNPAGDKWPYGDGLPHTQPYSYYELVPFVSAPYDSELFIVDSENSGWSLKPRVGGAPVGHPQGTYEYTETIKRRNVDELKALAKGYADRYNSELWPQENGYTEKLAYAKEQIAANNRLPQFTDLVSRHESLIQASFHNDARLRQLYNEIDAAGPDGVIDFVVSQMATEQFPEGWVNGIAQ